MSLLHAHRGRLMGPDHLLLWEALRRTSHDWVQPVRHLGSPVVRQDQEVQRPWHLLLPQMQRHKAVGTQKRPLGQSGTAGRNWECSTSLLPVPDMSFLWCLQPKQPELSPGKATILSVRQIYFDNHNSFILNLFPPFLFGFHGLFFFNLATVKSETTWCLRIINLPIISCISW